MTRLTKFQLCSGVFFKELQLQQDTLLNHLRTLKKKIKKIDKYLLAFNVDNCSK